MPFTAQTAPVDTHMPARGASGRRLLLVDQQLAFVGFARLVGRRMGYETSAILDPRELATRIQHWQPTVLVVEVGLPSLDGIEIIARLSELSYEGHLILVTADKPRDLEIARKAAAAMGLRVATCLAKPVRTAEMIRALELCEPAAAAHPA